MIILILFGRLGHLGKYKKQYEIKVIDVLNFKYRQAFAKYLKHTNFELQILKSIFEISVKIQRKSNMKEEYEKVIRKLIDKNKEKLNGEDTETKIQELLNNNLLYLVFTRQYDILYNREILLTVQKKQMEVKKKKL